MLWGVSMFLSFAMYSGNGVPTETSCFYVQRTAESLSACGLRGIACAFPVHSDRPAWVR
jgi:hypothetical protein